MDSHIEFSDRKRSREENPESLPSPDMKKKKRRRKKNKYPESLPSPDVKKKKRRRKKNKGMVNLQGEEESKEPILDFEPKNTNEKGAEPNAANLKQPQVCPNFEPAHSVEVAISTVPEKKNGVEIESNVATVENPELRLHVPDPMAPKEDTLKKKKREKGKKSVINHQVEEQEELSADKPQLYSELDPEPRITKEKGAEPYEANVDTVVPIELDKKEGTGSSEATSENLELFLLPEPTSLKETPEKKKNVVNRKGEEQKELSADKPQLYSELDPEPRITKGKGGEPYEANVDTVVPIELDKKEGTGSSEATSENPELFPLPDPTSLKETPQKKNVVNCQGEEPKESNAETCHLSSSVDTELKNTREKGAEPDEGNADKPQVGAKHELAAPVDTTAAIVTEKNKGAEPDEGNADKPQVGATHELAAPVDTTATIVTEKNKAAEPHEATAEHPQVSPKQDPAPLIEPAMPVAPNEATAEESKLPPDPKPRRRKCRRKNKSATGTKEPNAENHQHPRVCPKPELPAPHRESVLPIDPENKKGEEPTEGNVEHPQVCHKPESIPQIYRAITIMNPEKKKGAELSKANVETPQPCPKPAPVPLGDPTTPIDGNRKKRRSKRRGKKTTCLDEIVENSRNPMLSPVKPTLNQTEPEPAPLIDPAKPAIPIDPEQKTTNKKRKRKRKSSLKSEGAEPNEHKPDTLVHISVCPMTAPPTDCTMSIDRTTPIDLEQKMTKKKRKTKRKSELKSEGAEPNDHNAMLLAEIPVKKPESPEGAEPNDHNAMLLAEIPVKKPESPKRLAVVEAEIPVKKPESPERLAVIEAPFKSDGEDYEPIWRCRVCQLLGHRYRRCPRRKRLTRDQEICFFCGEIGHSLKNCSVSRAGGGRFFAKCLLCHARGHFSNNCPRNRRDINPKVIAANGPINTPVGS